MTAVLVVMIAGHPVALAEDAPHPPGVWLPLDVPEDDPVAEWIDDNGAVLVEHPDDPATLIGLAGYMGSIGLVTFNRFDRLSMDRAPVASRKKAIDWLLAFYAERGLPAPSPGISTWARWRERVK